ncbi:CD9 antigen-like [Babylonia areolata]|uniref:CD9 antigen-like n=1 Tax=Babylonia areolata TaxID=304850 RepID=UPI003FD2554B
MALGGCYSIIKYFMFAYNFIFWLLGCATLGLGIWLRVDPTAADYFHWLGDEEVYGYLRAGAFVFIGVGIGVMLIGFLGCGGAVCESAILLGVFFVLLFIIFAHFLGFGIWALAQGEELRDEVGEALDTGVETYNTRPALMDSVHFAFECCGSRHGAKDFEAEFIEVPNSCTDESRDMPCQKAIMDFITTHVIIVPGIFLAVLIVGMVLSLTLCCAIRYVNAA